MTKTSKRVPLTKDCIGKTLAQDVFSVDSVSVLLGRNTVISQYAYKKLVERNVHDIHIWVETKSTGKPGEVKRDKLELTHLAGRKKLEVVFNDILNSNEVSVEKIDKICSDIKVAPESKNTVFQFLSDIKSSSDATYTHCVNVSVLAGLLGAWLELSEDEIQQLMTAALMHDIGKTLIDQNILKKQGQLTPDEREDMQSHTTQGYEYLQKNDFSTNICLAALSHHERIGGSGYPRGLKTKEEIPYFARIIAVLDIFDAASHARIYRKDIFSPFSIIKAFQEELFGQLDIDIVDVFISNVAYMYKGETCRLSDGRLGEIVFINPAQIQSPMINVGNEIVDLKIRRDLFISEVYLS